MNLRRDQNRGVALFILTISLIVMALLMKEFLLASRNQVDRVRNYTDRIQAVYLARSTLNLARFFIMFDEVIDKQLKNKDPSDSNSDLWANPIPFPVPVETIMMAAGAAGEAAEQEVSPEQQELFKQCNEFFDDFNGNAVSTVSDLSARINLNDLDEAGQNVFKSLVSLLTPNVEFIQQLDARRILPENLAREIRDYMDRDDIENETKGSELSPYSSAQLSYKPKNRPFSVIDELKLIPSVDDELFEYLSPYVSAVYIANRSKPAKINLNTVSKNVFQSLLTDVSNPESVSEEFIKDREENSRIYTAKTFTEVLQNTFQLTSEEIRLNLLTGVSSAFQVETEAQVNQTMIKLTTVIPRISGSRKINPLLQMRISP